MVILGQPRLLVLLVNVYFGSACWTPKGTKPPRKAAFAAVLVPPCVLVVAFSGLRSGRWGTRTLEGTRCGVSGPSISYPPHGAGERWRQRQGRRQDGDTGRRRSGEAGARAKGGAGECRGPASQRAGAGAKGGAGDGTRRSHAGGREARRTGLRVLVNDGIRWRAGISRRPLASNLQQ